MSGTLLSSCRCAWQKLRSRLIVGQNAASVCPREDAVTFSVQLLPLGKEMPPLNRNAEELKAEV